MKRIEIGIDVTKFGYKRKLCEHMKIFPKKLYCAFVVEYATVIMI